MVEKRFQKGDKISLFSVLLEELGKNNYVYLRDRPMNPKIIENMSLRTLRGFVNSGVLFKSIDSKGTETSLVFFETQ